MNGSSAEEGRGVQSLLLESSPPFAGESAVPEADVAWLEQVGDVCAGRRDGRSLRIADERAEQLGRERTTERGRAFGHRVVSWVSANLFDHLTYTARNGLNRGLRRRGGLGWLPMEHDTPESRFWKSLDLRGKVVYDVGAFHGLLTIHYARDARVVVAWEPNSRNRRRLMENVKLNQFSNVMVRPYGLSSKAARAEMSYDLLTPGMASVDHGVAGGSERETIELRTLDGEEGIEPPDLIKIDVEGFELEVLKGATKTLERGPDLFLEMHGAGAEDKRRRVQAIADYLWALGYSRILHVETAMRITPVNSAAASQGHLYARRADKARLLIGQENSEPQLIS